MLCTASTSPLAVSTTICVILLTVISHPGVNPRLNPNRVGAYLASQTECVKPVINARTSGWPVCGSILPGDQGCGARPEVPDRQRCAGTRRCYRRTVRWPARGRSDCQGCRAV